MDSETMSTIAICLSFDAHLEEPVYRHYVIVVVDQSVFDAHAKQEHGIQAWAKEFWSSSFARHPDAETYVEHDQEKELMNDAINFFSSKGIQAYPGSFDWLLVI